MFDNILICSFVPKNNKRLVDIAFELTKKFNSNTIMLKCIYEDIPTFAFFKIKSEKKKHEDLIKKVQVALKEIEEMAKHHNIFIKTDNVFTESLSTTITTYIQKNNIDLLIVDSISPSDVDDASYKDIINHIYKNSKCNILT